MIAAPVERMRGPVIPGHEKTGGDGRYVGPHEIDLPHPAIEALPEFVCRVESGLLSHGIRHYNGSIARHLGRIYMAYRVESFRGVSSVGVCELDATTLQPVFDALLKPEVDELATNIEDPHMASVGGKLVVVVSNVVRRFPPICRQRMLEINPSTLGIEREIPMPFGSPGIEKNWTPFELPDGELAVVYKQKPRMVIRVADKKGWSVPEVPVAPPESSCSGRTGPLRLPGGRYLEFVGGHVKMQHRGTRYWFGAVVFEAKEPFKIIGWTKNALVWASEASPTIFNPLPRGGHPVCILPAGAMFEGDSVLVSCGVNDSYNVILRFNLHKLLGEMVFADA